MDTAIMKKYYNFDSFMFEACQDLEYNIWLRRIRKFKFQK